MMNAEGAPRREEDQEEEVPRIEGQERDADDPAAAARNEDGDNDNNDIVRARAAAHGGDGNDQEEAELDDESESYDYDDDDDDDDGIEGGDDMPISRVLESAQKIAVDVKLEQNDPLRMKLTADEYVCTSGIRNAFETMCPDIDVNDFWYAQYAIICNDNKEDAIEKCIQLQHVKEQYDIADTLEEGKRALRGMVKLMPEFFLSFGFHDGAYVLGLDFSKFDATQLRQNHAHFKTYMAGWYYLCGAFHCDFFSIRKGVKCILECQDVTWRMKVDFKIVYQVAQELLSAYPHFSIIEHFNMGYVFSILGKMAMRPLPKEIRDRMIFGSKTPNGESMRSLYLSPTVEEANERVIGNMQKALERRYENEQNFSIPVVGATTSSNPEVDDQGVGTQ